MSKEQVAPFKLSPASNKKMHKMEVEYLRSRLPYECIIMLTQTEINPHAVGKDQPKRKNVMLNVIIEKVHEFHMTVRVLPNRDMPETLPWSMIKKIIPLKNYDKDAGHTS